VPGGLREHGRDHDQDQHDPPDHPEQMIRRPLRSGDLNPAISTSTKPIPVPISHFQLSVNVPTNC
jgi:hypothetical protein